MATRLRPPSAADVNGLNEASITLAPFRTTVAEQMSKPADMPVMQRVGHRDRLQQVIGHSFPGDAHGCVVVTVPMVCRHKRGRAPHRPVLHQNLYSLNRRRGGLSRYRFNTLPYSNEGDKHHAQTPAHLSSPDIAQPLRHVAQFSQGYCTASRLKRQRLRIAFMPLKCLLAGKNITSPARSTVRPAADRRAAGRHPAEPRPGKHLVSSRSFAFRNS